MKAYLRNVLSNALIKIIPVFTFLILSASVVLAQTDPFASSVSFSGTLNIGQTLTGTYTWNSGGDADNEGTSTYKWFRSDDGSGTNKSAITGETSITYVLSTADQGKYISFSVIPFDDEAVPRSGPEVESSLQGPVNSYPTVSGVSVTGTLTVGSLLTGNYTFNDSDSDLDNNSTYKWSRDDDGAGTNKVVISGATSSTYTITTTDLGKHLYFEVTPASTTGSSPGSAVESSAHGPVVNSVPTASSVSISGTLTIGSTLTGNYTYNDVDGDADDASTYKWSRDDDGAGTNKVIILGATSQTYTLVAADQGKHLYFEVTPASTTGASPGSAVESAASAVVNSYPTASAVAVSGTLTIGSTLTGNYSFNDADGDTDNASTYKWSRDDDGAGANKAPIAGATSSTYVLASADQGKHIYFEVTPGSSTGSSPGSAVESTASAAVNSYPTASAVAVSGTLTIGSTLTGNYSFNDADGDADNASTYKWSRDDDGAGTNKVAIAGATSSTYVLTSTDQAKYIYFEVIPGSSTGSSPGNAVESAASAVVNSYPTVSAVAISGTLAEGNTLVGNYSYADVDSDTEGSSTFRWFRDDDGAGTNKTVIIGATSNTYTLVSADQEKYIYFEVTPVASAGSSPGIASESSPVGPVACTPPSTQASGLSLSNVLGGSIQVNWTPGNGSATLIVVKQGSAVNQDPADGSSYTANLDFTLGQDIGSGNIVVYDGSTSPQTITGLSTSTTYHFALYEYNSAKNCYNLASVATANATTIAATSTSTITLGYGAASVSSIVNLVGDEVTVFSFTMKDLGDDGLDTEFTQLIFTQGPGNDVADWTTVIAGAQLYHNEQSGVEHGTAVINATSITIPSINRFSNRLGEIDEGETKTYQLKIYLKSNLGVLKSTIDGKNLAFELLPGGFTMYPDRSLFNPATGTHSNADLGDNNPIDVTASKIVYTTEPSTSAIATVALVQQPVLEARDANDNLDLDFAETIAVTTPDAALSPNSAPTSFSAGIASFTSSGFNLQSLGTSKIRVTTGTSGFIANSAASTTVTASTNVAQVTGGIAASPLNSDGTNQALLGFSLTTTGSTINFTGATITTTTNPDGRIKNIKLYRSTDASYSTTGDNSLIAATITTPTSTTIDIASITESINGSAAYFFIVADIESQVSSFITTPIQLSIANNSDISVSVGSTTGTSFSGTNYSFNDITLPAAFSVGSVITTGGTIVANYWNSTNTGANITVPIANDATVDNGTVQLQARVGAFTFANIGAASTITAINTNKVVSLTGAQIRGMANYAEGAVIEFRAVIADRDGNATAGTASTTKLTVDEVAPAIPAIPDMTALTDSGNNTDNITNDNTPDFTGAGTDTETINLISNVNGNIGTAVVAGSTWTITASSTLAEGSHNITATATDIAGNISAASTALLVTIDTNVPSFTSVDDGGGDNSYTSGETITFIINLGETGLNVTGDLTVINSGFSATQAFTDNGDGTYKYVTSDIDISGLMQEGTNILVTFTATDVAGNTVNNNTLSLYLDKTNPVVSSIIRDDAQFNNTQSVSYTVTFNENVTGVDIADFSVSLSASIPAATVASVTPISASQYTVVVNAFDLNDAYYSGLLRLNFVTNSTVKDNIGLVNTASYFTGEVYTIIHPEPAEDVPTINFVTSDNKSIQINWTKSVANQVPNRYLLLVKESGTFPSVSDGTFIADDTDLSDGLVAYNIDYSTAFPYVINNLNSGTSYDLIIYPHTNDGAQVDYKTTSPATTTIATTTASVSTITFSSAPVSFSSLTTASSGAIAPQQNAIANFTFTIKDDGPVTTEPEDNSPLTISDIVITQGTGNGVTDWTTALAGAELSDGTNSITGTVNTTNITFSSIPSGTGQLGKLEDNEGKIYTLKVWLLTSLPDGIDGKNFVFDVNEANITINNPVTSSHFILGENANSGSTNNIIDVTATQLSFTQQPQAAIGVLNTFSPAPVVTAQDANNNRDLDFSNTVTAITNTDGIIMNAQPTIFTAGNLVLTTINYADAGNGTLTVSAGALTSPASSTVTVSYSDNTTITNGTFVEPATLASTFTSYRQVAEFTITDDAAGTITDDKAPTLITKIIVKAKSGANALTTDWSDVIEQAALATNGGGSPLKIVPNANVNSNSITFDGLLTTVGEIGYISDDGSREIELWLDLKTPLTGTVSNIIDNMNFIFEVTTADVTTGTGSSTIAASQTYNSDATKNFYDVTATQLSYEQQPSTTFINEVMSPAVQIEATDIYGSRDKDSNKSATITSSGSLSTTPAVTLTNGVGTVTDVTHNAIATGLTLTATDTDTVTPLTSIVSNTFDILPGNAESDIITSAITYDTNIPYKDFVTASVSNTDPKVFQFDISDGTSGGTATDSDILPTNIISLSFDVVNSNVLQTIGLFDNSDVLIAQVPSSPTITFNLSTTPIVIADNGVETYHLRTTFKTSVIDNAQFTFTVATVIANDQGSSFEAINGLRTSGTVATSSTSGDDNRIEVIATDAVFTSQPNPTNISTYTNIDNPYIVVEAQDLNFNTDLDFNGALGSVTNNFTPVLTTQNDPSGNFTSGVFDFQVKAPTYQFTTDGLGGQLIVAAIGLADGTSNNFDVSASQESYITYVADGGKIPYVDYPPTSDLTNANSYTIAEFMLHDGNPALYGNDIDGATTVIGSISIDLTNFINLDKVGIFDASGTQYGADEVAAATVTFTGVNFIAADNLTNNFFIKASFKDNNTDITDGAIIDVVINNVVAAGGSKFEDTINNTGGAPDGTGGYVTARTPAGNNLIDVVATKFVFTQQPSAIEGLNVSWEADPANPTIESHDINDNIDLEYVDNYTIVAAGTSLNQVSVPAFTNGVLNLSNLRYTSTGDGTLTIEDLNFPLASQSTVSNTVEVINTALSFYNISEFKPQGATTLQSAVPDMTLLGFELSSGSNGTNPTFESITIDFKDGVNLTKDITDIFENIRLYKVDDPLVTNPVINTIDYSIVSGASVNTGFSTANSIVIDGFSEALDINNPSYYVVIADIAAAANVGSGSIKATIIPSKSFVAANNGSVSGTAIEGNLFDFIDTNTPSIVLTDPVNASIATPFTTTSFSFTFDEPVTQITLVNPKIELREFVGDALVVYDSVSVLADANGKLFTLSFWDNTTNPTVPVEIALNQATRYYILIEPGEFADNSNNFHTGFTDKGFWNFTTTDSSPPNFVFNVSNSELIANSYDIGFDVKVKFDEPAIAYALALPSADPDPVSYADIKNHANTVSVNVNTDSTDYYIQIRGLSAGNYNIYVVAEDLGGNEMGINYNSSTDEAQKVAAVASTFTDLVSDPVINICVGEYQDINLPLTIIEGSNNDFNTGTLDIILPANYVFDTSVGNATVVNSPADITITSFSYRNNSTISVKITDSGTSRRDEIRIAGLKIKALADAIDGTVIVIEDITGSGSNDIPYADNAASLIVTSLPAAQFILTPAGETINANTLEPIGLTQVVPIDPFLGESYLFTGNGVNNDSLFVNLAPLGENTITLTQTYEGGCQAFGSKIVNIIDKKIIGLEFKYCDDFGVDAIPKTLLPGDPENVFNGTYDLEYLTANVNQILTNPGDISSWDEVNFTLSTALAIPDTSTAEFVSIDFVGLYRNSFDVNDSIPITQTVRIYPAPVVLLASGNLADTDADGTIEACEYFGTINFNAEPAQNLPSVIGIFSLAKSNGDDANMYLIDGGDGTASFNTQDIADDDSLGAGAYELTYTYNSLTSTCGGFEKLIIIINPKPVTAFSLIGKSTFDGCVDELITFQNETDILANSTFNWSFDDADNSSGTNANESTDTNPAHYYTSNGTYNTSLIATTDKGCISDQIIGTLSIGNNPVTSFDFTQVAIDKPTVFTNTTPTGVNTVVDSLVWTINGSVLAKFDSSDSQFNLPYEHTFTIPGSQEVILTTITDKFCSVSDTLDFFTVPEFVLSNTAQYKEDFDSNNNTSAPNGSWLTWGGKNSSWGVGTSGGDSIKSTSNFWVTGVNTLHNNDEESYVYSPVFNITDLERPMLQLEKFTHLNTSDGVVIEYTVDNLFGSSKEGIIGSWHLLGSLESGDEWYDYEGISNIGGNQQTGQYGWSGSDKVWKKSKHTLGSAKAEAPNQNDVAIQFRVSFKSGNNNFGNFNGFAFDDVEIGNRTRTVLLENFTSMAKAEDTKTQNDAINDLVNNDNGTEIILLTYHTSFDGDDFFNLANPSEPGSRALYYGISENPRVAIDGFTSADGSNNSNELFTEWGNTFYSRRTLQIAQFDIDVSISNIGDGNLHINTDLTAKQNIDSAFVVYAVVVEKELSADDIFGLGQLPISGESFFYNTVREMLPDASGWKFQNGMQSGNTINLDAVWNPSNIIDPTNTDIDESNIQVIVFAQNEVSREILQSARVTVNVSTNLVLGIEDDLDENSVVFYPNPADEQLIVQLAKKPVKELKAIIFDNTGKKIEEISINPGQEKLQINTINYLPGIYLIALPLDSGSVTKRFIISH